MRLNVEGRSVAYFFCFLFFLVNKGVPIEQIKELMGHSNLDTTMIYAIVDREKVKYSHQKYVE